MKELLQLNRLYTLQHVVEFVIQAFFLDEKILLLHVVYEKYNSLLSMNSNAEFDKSSFTENNFSKFAPLLTFIQSLDQIKYFFLNFNLKQY